MKAKKAPERIYVPTAGLEMTDKLPCHIEYTRTDVFIEKVCKFLFEKYHGEKLSLRMIENFRRYLKGE